MSSGLSRISISTRRKLTSILLAVTIFAVLAGLATLAQGRPVIFGVLNAIFVGTGAGIFEQYYVQSLRGRWIRNIHPLLSISIYTFVISIMFFISINVSHLLLRPWYISPVPYGRLPIILPIVIVLSVIGIVVMRAVHFIGIETLFHLMIGTYHRPVVEQKVLVFVDINNSTALAERLGALKIKSLVGKFLFDISKPITDHGGDIYLYKGDGLIAIWDWGDAVRGNRMLSCDRRRVRRRPARAAALHGAVRGGAGLPHRGAWRRCGRQRARRHEAVDRHLRQHDQHCLAHGGSGKAARRRVRDLGGCGPSRFRTPMAACIKSALTGSKEFPPKSRFSNIGSGPRRVRRRPGAAGGRATADGRETRRRARLQRLAKGQIDPAGSGQRVLAPGERGDAVIDETRRAAPHHDVASSPAAAARAGPCGCSPPHKNTAGSPSDTETTGADKSRSSSSRCNDSFVPSS